MSPIRLRYQTVEFEQLDVHLRTLRDVQQFEDADGEAEALGISSAIWPLFGVLWPSGHALAELMLDYPIEGARILEVGCGIGLASLVLNHRDADITATDHHPEAGAFLEANVALNGGEAIPFVRTGWVEPNSGLGEFDLIIGSDLIYETGQVAMLSSFVDQHAKEHCTVLLVDPGRGQSARFDKAMVALGYETSRSQPQGVDSKGDPFEGHILRYDR
jgi:predicted nicotinamide N-methyase